jgi:chromosome segregation ATPase
MTLEEAQAEIVRLNDELTAANNDKQTLSQNNENLSKELEQVRTINQQYFNRLMAQNTDPAGTETEEEEAPTCEEFAKTLNI